MQTSVSSVQYRPVHYLMLNNCRLRVSILFSLHLAQEKRELLFGNRVKKHFLKMIVQLKASHATLTQNQRCPNQTL